MSAVPPSRPGFDNDWRWNMLLRSVSWRGCSVEPWIISRRQRKQLKLWRVTRGGSGGKMSKAHARVQATVVVPWQPGCKFNRFVHCRLRMLSLFRNQPRRRRRNRNIQFVHRPERRQWLVEFAHVAHPQYRPLLAGDVFRRDPRHVFFRNYFDPFLKVLQKIQRIAVKL